MARLKNKKTKEIQQGYQLSEDIVEQIELGRLNARIHNNIIERQAREVECVIRRYNREEELRRQENKKKKLNRIALYKIAFAFLSSLMILAATLILIDKEVINGFCILFSFGIIYVIFDFAGLIGWDEY